MATKQQIYDLALQSLGSPRTTVGSGTREDVLLDTAYQSTLMATLSENAWTFATTRAELNPTGTAPIFGRRYAYDLPANWLRPAPVDPDEFTMPTDWMYEGNQILTDDGGPLRIRYVRSDVTEANFSWLFTRAFASQLAYVVGEELTQSASKGDKAAQEYLKYIRTAKRQNAILVGSIYPEYPSELLARL